MCMSRLLLNFITDDSSYITQIKHVKVKIMLFLFSVAQSKFKTVVDIFFCKF